MVALAVVGLAVSFVYALVQFVAAARDGGRRQRPRGSGAAEARRWAGALAAAGARLAAAWRRGRVVVLDCSAAGAQFALIIQLIYPASLGVTLVLLFDKATRTWGKGRRRVVREWLFCDLLVFLLVVAFFNCAHAKPEAYARASGTFSTWCCSSPLSG